MLSIPALSFLTLLLSPAGEDVRFPSGELVLAGELLLPESDFPVAGAVLLQGSGDSDRSNGWAAAIAHELVASGVAVLLTDKRGCGASQGEWRTAGFDALAGDALAGFAYLRSRPEVDPRHVGLVGLSQGGWVAPVAAAREPAVAFVVDVSGAAVGFLEQTNLEMANTTRAAGLDEEAVDGVLALQRAAGRYARGGSFEAYAEERRRALASSWKAIAEGFPATPELPIWTFLRAVGAFDPMPYWVSLDAPVLVLYGALDEQDNVPVAESVRRLEHGFRTAHKQNARIRVIAGTGHAFLTLEHQLMDEFVDELSGWIESTTH